MKRTVLVILGVVGVFFLASNIAFAATNQDALAGLVETLKAIASLADSMVKTYIEYLRA